MGNRPAIGAPSTSRRQIPLHLLPREVEQEFVCAMGWAAQKAANGDEHALDYFRQGAQLDPADLFLVEARAVFEIVLQLAEKGEFPAWSLIKAEVTHQLGLSDQLATRLRFLTDTMLAGAFVSAIPSYEKTIREAAEGRRYHAGLLQELEELERGG